MVAHHLLSLALLALPGAALAAPCTSGSDCDVVQDLERVLPPARHPRGPRGPRGFRPPRGPRGIDGAGLADGTSADEGVADDGGDTVDEDTGAAVADAEVPDDEAGAGTGEPVGDLYDLPNTDDRDNVLAILDYLAEQTGLPTELLYAVAWTESNMNQWDSSGAVIIGGQDYGLMQINQPTWDGTYDWERIQSDVRYNASAGADILLWSYNYAGSQGYTGDDQLKAAYAVYNGGPNAVDRPWDPTSPWAAHDVNFWNNYTSRPWED